MLKLNKTLSLILLLNVMYAHSMEETKGFPLIFGIPNEILRVIIKYPNPNDLFNDIQLLITLGSTCKKFQYLSAPQTIKTILALDQKKINMLFESCAYTNTYTDNKNFTPFLKLLIAMHAQTNSICKTLNDCVTLTKSAYMVEYFITHHDNNVDQQDKSGYTPLQLAIVLNKPDIVNVLLEHNANMYLADKEGRTPTEMALLSEFTECILVLIKHGVDTTIEYSRGESRKETIAEWAKKNATYQKENVHVYEEIYTLVTGKELPKPRYKKSCRELLNDTCVIS